MTSPSLVDPAALPHLQVQATEVPGVWHVRLPLWPWQYASAEDDREALVGRITDTAAVRRLWLSDSADDSHGQWLSPAADRTLAEAGGSGLAYGDWLLLFFDSEPSGDTPPPSPTYPKTPADAMRQLEAYGAAAAIWSWLDDADWLVAIRS